LDRQTPNQKVIVMPHLPQRFRSSIAFFSMDRQRKIRTLRKQFRSSFFEQLESRRVMAGLAVLVEDSLPGGGISAQFSSSPKQITDVSGTPYFKANDGVNGDELWRVNSAGIAELVEDSIPGGGIRPGSDGAVIDRLANINGTLYFKAFDGITNGAELWRVNSAGVAEIVEDAVPGGGIVAAGGSYPAELTNVNGSLYFRATIDGQIDHELMRINSAGIAEIVEDSDPSVGLRPGPVGSSPKYLTNVGGTLYFVAGDDTNGPKLWRVNSSGIAEIVEDLNGGVVPNPTGFSPRRLTEVSGTLYYMATDGVNGYELWKVGADGKAQMIEDAIPGGGINPGVTNSEPNSLTNVNGQLYFTADDGVNGGELWRINGSGRAEMVEDNIPGGGLYPAGQCCAAINSLTNVAGTLYFTGQSTAVRGRELWRVNSSGIAEVVDDSVPGVGISGSFPDKLTNVDGTLFFGANDGPNGQVLWRVDSSGFASKVLSANLGGVIRLEQSGFGYGGGFGGGYGSTPTINRLPINGTLYFSGSDGVSGNELWQVTSTGFAEMVEDSVLGGGIRPGSFGSSPKDMANVNGRLFFSAEDGSTGRELWNVRTNSQPTSVELNQSQTFFENQAPSSEVGTFNTLDPDVGNTFTYTLITGSEAFVVDGATLRSTIVFDSEVTPAYSILVRSTDQNGLYVDGTINILIGDIDEFDANQLVDQDVSPNVVSENAVNGSTVHVTAFSKDDDVTNSTISYKLLDSAGEPLVGGPFGIDSVTGVITVLNGQLLNYEVSQSQTLHVRATSLDGSFSTEDFDVILTDENEVPISQVADIDLTIDSVPENSTFGTVIGVTAYAFDADGSASVSYSLDPSGPFAINSITGVITVAGSIDYEAGASHGIIVKASSTDGSFSTLPLTISVEDVPESIPPVIGAFDTPINFVENAAAQLLDSNATLTDVDSLDFVGGVLTVSLVNNAENSDRLLIRNVGTGVGQIGISGSQITYSGNVIGSFSGGTAVSSPLVVLFGAGASKNAAQSLLRNLVFSNLSESPSSLPRSVQVVVTDGDGGVSLPALKTINVVSVNDAPIISGFTGTVSYSEGGAPVLISPGSTITDVDSLDFDTGRLTVRVSANLQSSDRISITNQGMGTGQIGVVGSNVYFGGTLIGTYAGVTSLVVTLNPNADSLAVQALIANISYSNVSGNPSTLPRTVSASLTDGDGGTSTTVFKTVQVSSINNAPTIGGFTPDVTYIENAAPLLIDSNATVVDVDSSDFAGGVLTVRLTANGHADDRLDIRNQGVAVNQIGINASEVTFGGVAIGTFSGGTSGLIPLEILLNSSATPASIQALVRNLRFSNVSDSPSTLARIVELQLTDGDGGTSTPVSKIINVTDVNDAPIIGAFDGNVGYVIGGPAIALDSDATVEDPDSGNFNLGILRVSLTTNRQPSDRIEILGAGNGAGQIGVINNEVYYEGVLIGSFSGTTTLTISLNANADKLATQALLRSITFSSLSLSPLSRTVSVSLSDGMGGTSVTRVKTIDMI
jgi:ELWxxDGT repeat protein